jgi:hypothetical protein
VWAIGGIGAAEGQAKVTAVFEEMLRGIPQEKEPGGVDLPHPYDLVDTLLIATRFHKS